MTMKSLFGEWGLEPPAHHPPAEPRGVAGVK